MVRSKRMRDLRAAKELLTGEWEKQLKELDEKSEALQAQHFEKTGKIYCDFTVPVDEKERCEICKETAQNASDRLKVQVEVWDWEARRAKNKQKLSRRVDWSLENDYSAFRGRQRDKSTKQVVDKEALESVKSTIKATSSVKATGAWLEEGSLVKNSH